MTDIESIRRQIVKHLPVRVRWLVDGTPLDFDFSRSQAPLRSVMSGDFNNATVIEKGWTALWIFGDDDYAEGGGASAYLGIHSESGAIFGLDVERETSPMFLLNSNADRFIQTFLALDRVLRPGGVLDPNIEGRLKQIDPDAFEHSEWKLLLFRS